MQDTWIWSLGWEDPLEKGMITYSSILAWRIPQAEEPGGLQTVGYKALGMTKWPAYFFAFRKPTVLQFPALD